MGSTSGAEWTREALAELICRILSDGLLACDGGLTPRSKLLDAGLDSLTVTQLMLALEEETGVWTDESLLTPENLDTADALARCIHEHVLSD